MIRLRRLAQRGFRIMCIFCEASTSFCSCRDAKVFGRCVESRQHVPTVSMVKGVTYVLGDFTKQPDVFANLAPGPCPIIDLDDEWSPSFVGVMYYRTAQSRVDETTVWDIRVRMIAIDLEDPACGSGSWALGAYLALRFGQQSRKHRLNIDQGSEIGRDSQIIVSIELNESRDKVENMQLAEPATSVTQGKIFLD